MFRNICYPAHRLMLCASAAALAAGFAALPAVAQDVQAGGNPSDSRQSNQSEKNASDDDKTKLSQSKATEIAVGNLLQNLVNRRVLSRDDAQTIMNTFHADLKKGEPEKPPPEPEAGAVRVPYVSETVKEEITNRVKEKVVQTAKDEHWAAPDAFPEWTKRITLFGDVRLRDEARYFGEDNYYGFVNVNTINNSDPYDVNGTVYPAIENSNRDRNYLRVRARLGFHAQVTDEWSATLRLASGSDTSPVSTNQTLGGFYTKKSIWLDQAYIKYEPWKGDTLVVGRMPNPFDHTELVWDDDINLDGIAATASYAFGGPLSTYVTLGAFPLDYVDDSDPEYALSTDKTGQGGDKWLFASQIGARYVLPRFTAGLSAAFYYYDNIQGKLSPSCSNAAAYCLTDYSRPGFMQKGNTLFALRDTAYTYDDDGSIDYSDPQYYGLASEFKELDIVARADYKMRNGLHVMLTGDYVRNFGYDKSAITSLPIVNNNETCSVTVDDDETCSSAGGSYIFKSGDTAWSVTLGVGHAKIEKRWDWSTAFTYAYLDPDSTLDAFTNSDFHLGGTNAKGWILGGKLGVAENVWLSFDWLSADEVSGPPYAVDVMHLDLNLKF